MQCHCDEDVMNRKGEVTPAMDGGVGGECKVARLARYMSIAFYKWKQFATKREFPSSVKDDLVDLL